MYVIRAPLCSWSVSRGSLESILFYPGFYISPRVVIRPTSAGARDISKPVITPVKFAGHTTMNIPPEGEIAGALLRAILRATRVPGSKNSRHFFLVNDKLDVMWTGTSLRVGCPQHLAVFEGGYTRAGHRRCVPIAYFYYLRRSFLDDVVSIGAGEL